MKNILKNMSEEEKRAILEQHTGGKKFNTEKFYTLLEAKLGDVKPINEQFSDKFSPPSDLGSYQVIQPIQISVKSKDDSKTFLVILNKVKKHSTGCNYQGNYRGDSRSFIILKFSCDSNDVTVDVYGPSSKGGYTKYTFGGGPSTISDEAVKKLNKSCGCAAFVQNQQSSPNSQATV